MVAKRKSTGKSPAKSPKKQKTAEEVAVETITQALDGVVGRELAASEREMVAGIAPLAFASFKADRHPVEAKLAATVGEGLLMAGQSLGEKATATTGSLTQSQGTEAHARQSAEQSRANLELAEAALTSAQEAVETAEEQQTAAEKAHAAQEKAEAGLAKEQDKLTTDAQTYITALEVAQSSEPSAAETKKLVATLKSAGASGPLVDGIGKAVGKEGGVEALFIAEAVKVLQGKLGQVQTTLGNWDGHVQAVTAATAQTAGAVEHAKETVGARTSDEAAARDSQKQAKQELKGAEAELKDASKSVSAASKKNDKALADLQAAEEAGKAFDFLYNRAPAAEEPEPSE